jgi:hypothetical protein
VTGPAPLAGQAVPHEHDPAVGRPADAGAARGDGADLQLELLLEILRFGHWRSSTVGRRTSPGAGPSSSPLRSADDRSW